MARSEYMHFKTSDLPESVVQLYNPVEKTTRYGYVYVDIKQGMCGIPQAGLITLQLLEKPSKSSCDPFIHELNVKQSRLASVFVGFLDVFGQKQ